MKVGRNDPCPCGSGKKYKHCCLRLERGASESGLHVAGGVRRVAAAAEEWQADVVPVMTALDNDPAARPAALLVTADGLVVVSDVLARPSPEVEDLARTLETGVRKAAEHVGGMPPRLRVRDDDVAAALAARFAGAGNGHSATPEVVAGEVDDVDEAAAGLNEHLTGRPGRLRASRPVTWAGWGLPEEWVARLFSAAAAYYRAAPWKLLADTQPFEVTGPRGTRWTACVLGQAGVELGLNLYADARDHALALSDVPQEEFEPRGEVILLSFDSGGEQSRLQRREVLGHGWELAGSDAYPQLITLNTPAGGLRRRTAEDLVDVLRAVPAFVATLEDDGASPAGAPWHHEATGCDVFVRLDSAALYGPLRPGGAEGPGADPQAVFAGLAAVRDDPQGFITAELRLIERFAGHLEDGEGFAAATVEKHADNAARFVEHLAGAGVPLRAVHQRDLLDYLFDWYPRKVDDGVTRRRALPVSLGRFFAFLADRVGIVCPWAAAVLDDREALERAWGAAPLGPWWASDVILWRSAHHAGLADLLLCPDDGLGGSDEWGPTMGQDEHALYAELERRWLLWRDELLRSGIDERGELRQRLIERQRAWERSPHPDFGGDPPRTVVLRERRTPDG